VKTVLKDYLMPFLVIAAAGLMIHDHFARPLPGPGPVDPTVNGAALGQNYAPMVINTLADGWELAAKTMDEGKPVSECAKALQASWKPAREKAFTTEVAPGFAFVLPEGTEPASPAKRAQVAALWRSFAAGLRAKGGT
jgi:hypothetical protein